MKLSKQTIDVLGNFSSIYNCMVFNAGKKQRTNSMGQGILADVELAEDFPETFGIYDMSQFLGTLSLFDEPDIELKDKYLLISEGNSAKGQKSSVTYRYCDVGIINKKLIPLDRSPTFPSVDIEFDMDKELFNKIGQATRVLKCSFISIQGDGKKIVVRSVNPSDKDASYAAFEVGETSKNFKMNLNLENMLLMPHNYKVQISKNRLSKFISQDMELTYLLPCEKDSVFSD